MAYQGNEVAPEVNATLVSHTVVGKIDLKRSAEKHGKEMSYATTKTAKIIVKNFVKESGFTYLRYADVLEKEIEQYAGEKVLFSLECFAKAKCPRCYAGEARASNPEVESDRLAWHANGMSEKPRRQYFTPCHAYQLWELLAKERIALMVNGNKP